MAPSTSPSANLSRTVAQAVSFLVSPLVPSYPMTAVSKLQLLLEANLTALYAPTWTTMDPLKGSASRSLSLSPHCLPSRPIYSACLATGVQWFEWIALLGKQELTLFVDPGCVTVQYGPKDSVEGKTITVWLDQPTSASRSLKPSPINVERAMQTMHRSSKTYAQQLLENDDQADDQLFAILAHEINEPTWVTPVDVSFFRPQSPSSTISAHSRCSSRSSNSSSGLSHTSAQSSATSLSSASITSSQHGKQSRREKAKNARIFVDTSKTSITPYDGGKTTVLTGGVMLGGNQKRPMKVNAHTQ